MTPRHWQPLVETNEFETVRPEVVAVTARHYGMDEDAARDWLEKYTAESRYLVNNLYQVQVRQEGDYLHLNIRRRDGGMVRDWRHFQQIKNEIAGPEREAVELYPAESRLVDTTNKWHLWVLPEGAQTGFGWSQRDVSYDERRHVPGLRQRPL